VRSGQDGWVYGFSKLLLAGVGKTKTVGALVTGQEETERSLR
jgi:hypothetical protein